MFNDLCMALLMRTILSHGISRNEDQITSAQWSGFTLKEYENVKDNV